MHFFRAEEFLKIKSEFFEEKEVRVYYKSVGDTFVLLTVKARYGKIFLREEVRESENRI
ncbi:hypothetical protein HKBW3S42_00864 [Candidatus Hakubella thermalkaliphila]|uniref:Uncharacterized protein n=1 Tax=Candidatus Hakubella thermalkaliphila TaxID=2754717 RepID=A0A6V8PK90_9ACTN|nr:hypothetical protein HKBW3S03_01240 [Candidatus Hakubella thermalkaliphila]GFP30883.1 hypothetical protein HKBW3S34_01802 [Candidatus Hakubella thermalkaliphila]GFP32560.1 hypothetical protein HKBW3S42_00864 [Candidatus Hakubella thermalkaliphila]GFP40174.1 hypothetical protein HKBW3S47_01871 [Candidatus Hakubella thermalkaliphila]